MSDASDHFLSAIRIAAFFGISGSTFALGFAMVCRALKWAPVNLTVNINDCRPREDVQRSPQESASE